MLQKRIAQGVVPATSFADLLKRGNHPPQQHYSQQTRPAIKGTPPTSSRKVNLAPAAPASQKRHAPPPIKSGPPPGQSYHLGNNANILAALALQPQTPFSSLRLSLAVPKAKNQTMHDENYKALLDSISAKLLTETVTALNRILTLSSDEAVKTPLAATALEIRPPTAGGPQDCRQFVVFAIKVTSSSSDKIAFIREHLERMEAGSLKLHNLPLKYAPATLVTKGRFTSSSMLVGLTTDMEVTSAVALALIRESVPSLDIPWLAQLSGDELVNGHSPSGPINVSFGSTPPPSSADLSFVCLVHPTDPSYEALKSGSPNNGGWTFFHDAFKSPSNPKGAVRMKVFARVSMAELLPPSPPAPTEAENRLASEQAQLLFAKSLITLGTSAHKALKAPDPPPNTGDAMDDDDVDVNLEALNKQRQAQMDFDLASKSVELAGTVTALGDNIMTGASELSAFKSAAIGCNKLKVVKAAIVAMKPKAEAFQVAIQKFEAKASEVTDLYESSPFDEQQVLMKGKNPYDDEPYSPAWMAYFSIMRGLHLLIPHIHKTGDNHVCDIDDVYDYSTNLQPVAVAHQEEEGHKADGAGQSKNQKTSAGQTASTSGVGGASLSTPRQ